MIFGFCFQFILFLTSSVETRAKDRIDETHSLVYRHQENSTKLLKERTHEVYRLKMTLERAIKALMDEISSLAEQRNRLMQALSVLEMPESIGRCFLSFFY